MWTLIILAFTTNSYNAPALTSIKFESKEACQNAAVFSQKQSVVGEVRIKAWCAKWKLQFMVEKIVHGVLKLKI